MEVFNIFPLTIVKDKIIIDENDRKILVDEIKKMKLEENNAGHTNYAWTGDTKGYEFLFSNSIFNDLSLKISKSIKN